MTNASIPPPPPNLRSDFSREDRRGSALTSAGAVRLGPELLAYMRERDRLADARRRHNTQTAVVVVITVLVAFVLLFVMLAAMNAADEHVRSCMTVGC